MPFAIAFNLINDIDVPQTEARIARFRKDNAALIEANIQRDDAYAASLRAQEDLDRLTREERARTLAAEEADERAARDAERRDLIDKLESSDKDATKLVAQSRAGLAKRHHARTAAAGAVQSNAKVLRSRAAQSAVPDVPHVPLQDDWYAYKDKFLLRQEGYEDPTSEAVRRDREGIMCAGGYVVEQSWERAVRCAVAGLDIQPLVGQHPFPSASTFDSGGDVVMANA